VRADGVQCTFEFINAFKFQCRIQPTLATTATRKRARMSIPNTSILESARPVMSTAGGAGKSAKKNKKSEASRHVLVSDPILILPYVLPASMVAKTWSNFLALNISKPDAGSDKEARRLAIQGKNQIYAVYELLFVTSFFVGFFWEEGFGNLEKQKAFRKSTAYRSARDDESHTLITTIKRCAGRGYIEFLGLVAKAQNKTVAEFFLDMEDLAMGELVGATVWKIVSDNKKDAGMEKYRSALVAVKQKWGEAYEKAAEAKRERDRLEQRERVRADLDRRNAEAKRNAASRSEEVVHVDPAPLSKDMAHLLKFNRLRNEEERKQAERQEQMAKDALAASRAAKSNVVADDTSDESLPPLAHARNAAEVLDQVAQAKRAAKKEASMALASAQLAEKKKKELKEHEDAMARLDALKIADKISPSR
jgi:hypothetical protein